jgi:hypothetical protein
LANGRQYGRRIVWLSAATILIAVYCAHYPLLKLPYFWDEAGYYIPIARDFFFSGSLIPHSVPSNAHPPLVAVYLAAIWRVQGPSILATRSAMVVISVFALIGVFRLALRVANFQVAWAATLCTAHYPVFFAQSSLAHVDLAAAAFTIWGLTAYLEAESVGTACYFVLAVLSKETAVVAPVALLAWPLICSLFPARMQETICSKPAGARMVVALFAPVAALLAWYSYHFIETGYVFGNPEFFRYNVQATLSPLRIGLAFAMRLWHSFGYMHLFVLTLLGAWAMTRPPVLDGDEERPRIAIATQCTLGAVLLAYVSAMAVIGGAVLARYMLPVIPLVIIVWVSTLWRRCRYWIVLVAVTCAAFVAALFMNPPYSFAFEDNLAYRDFVQLHQHAASFLEANAPHSSVLTAWPASDELTRPYLGYVGQPFFVVRIEDFSIDSVTGAADARSKFDTALLFSTKYEPEHPLLARWRLWQETKRRYFGFHTDLPPEVAAQILGGQIVFREQRTGQWVAIVRIDRIEEANLKDSARHQMAGMGLHHQPNFTTGR